MMIVSRFAFAAKTATQGLRFLCALASVQFAADVAVAETLGQVTAVDARRQAIEIAGELLTVKAGLELRDATDANGGGADETMPFQALSAGDYVLFEREGQVLTRLRRVAPSDIDVPPASPVPLRAPKPGDPR